MTELEEFMKNKDLEVQNGLAKEVAVAESWRYCLDIFKDYEMAQLETSIREGFKSLFGPDTKCVFMRSKKVIKVRSSEIGSIEL